MGTTAGIDFAQSVVAVFVLWLLANVAATPLYWGISAQGSALSARAEARLWQAFALLPLVVAVASVVVLYSPGLAQWIVFEHCHGEVCGAHEPHLATTAISHSILVLAAIAALLTLAYGLWRVQQHCARLSALLRLARLAPTERYWLIDSPHLLAWTVGLVKPQVVISTGLTERLPPAQLQAVLAHEFAHQRRRENLWKLILYKALVPSPMRHAVRARYDELVESICNQQAACNAELEAAARHWQQTTKPTPKAARSSPASVCCAVLMLGLFCWLITWIFVTSYHFVIERLLG